MNHFQAAVISLPTALTTHRGLLVANLGGSGVTNARGIEVAAQSGASGDNIGILNDGTLNQTGDVGFYGTTPQSKQTVSGSRGSNAALASLLTALASIGLITDSSS